MAAPAADRRPLKVLVVGAGIGGLAVARGLSRAGHRVTVLEKAPALRTDGAAISLWFNGMAALAQLGVSLEGCGQRIDRLELRRPHGRPLAAIDTSSLAGRFGVSAVVAPRRVVLERLFQHLPVGTVRFGARCRSVNVSPERPAVSLEDGTVEEADLVVGADGWHSVVRGFLGDASPVRSVGVGAWQLLIPMPESLASGHDFLYLIGGRYRAGFMPAGDGLVQSWFDVPSAPGDKLPGSPLAELRRRFGSWLSPAPEILEAATDADPELWQYVYRPVPRSLGQGAAAILGDAAHTMPPYLAQGANQALEDAAVLTDAVAAHSNPTEAVRSYSAIRRRRVAMVSRLAARPVAAGQLRWLELTTPRHGLPLGATTAVFGRFLNAVSNVLPLRSAA